MCDIARCVACAPHERAGFDGSNRIPKPDRPVKSLANNQFALERREFRTAVTSVRKLNTVAVLRAGVPRRCRSIDG